MITILAKDTNQAKEYAGQRPYLLVRTAKQLFRASKAEVYVLEGWSNMLRTCEKRKLTLMLTSLKLHPTCKLFRYDTIQ